MSIKNLDFKQQLVDNFRQAIKDGNEDGIAQALAEYADNIQQGIVSEAQAILHQHDTAVLASRNVRQLTSTENKYYMSLIDAMKSSDPKQALINIDVTLPQTIVESVFEDIKTQFPLLDYIDFKDGGAITNMIMCKDPISLGGWGALGSTISTQISGALMQVAVTQCKLSAYLPVANDMLDLGAQWLDRYVREILVQTIAYSLENAVVNGDGNNKPIGMTRQVGEKVTVTGGVYPKKTAIKVTSLEPVEYGELVSKLVKNEENATRKIQDLIMVVNPTDYLTRIMPATTVLNTQGQYVSNVLPVKTEIIESDGVAVGEMVLGLAKNYKLYASMGKQATITYDDSVKFLDDARVYAAKIHANGRATDDNDFILCDISGLEPLNRAIVYIEKEPTTTTPPSND